MALDDVVFNDGDKQNFIVEIPQDILHAPDDTVFGQGIQLFVIEIGDGPLNAPIDIVTDGASSNEVMFFNLTLTAGARYFAF